MKRAARGWQLIFRLLPFLLAFLRDRRRWFLLGRGANRRPEVHRARAEKLADTLASLGPTFIKLAQVLSSRADIFPEPYLSAVSTLQDQVPPDPTDRILAVMEAELGRPPDQVFDEFERKPVAAASLGQVHRARLEGRDVVVKVLRPGVEEMVALDLDLSFRILFWLNILFPNHHVRALTNVVREFSVRVREEMDFRSEARHMERFQRFFRHDPGVDAPEVIEGYVHRRVLVMEYLEGTKVDRLHDRLASGELDLDDLMERLTTLYLRMMMVDGFLHADPHPGNLLVARDGRIVVLDWGMVLEVPRWTRQAILGVALAVEREDLDGIINGMHQLGMVSPDVARGEIREAAAEVLDVLGRARSSSRERIQEIIHEILDTFYTWPLTLPQELVYFFRAAALLEGVAFRYDPEYDGLALIRRVIRASRRRIVQETSREPVDVAKDLWGEAHQLARSLRDLVVRAQREEFRVRIHPRDIQEQERFLHLQARRVLLAIFATATAVITSILFIAIPSWWLLTGGLGVSLFLFVLVFFIPAHLLENPLRHARGIRPR